MPSTMNRNLSCSKQLNLLMTGTPAPEEDSNTLVFLMTSAVGISNRQVQFQNFSALHKTWLSNCYVKMT